jgi:Lactoylglutathione lyase and related lyases
MSKQVVEKKQPYLMDLMTLYLPAKDPYATAKWYVDIFGFDPNASQHSPLQEGEGLVVLHTASDLTLFFVRSEDKLPLSFNNNEGYNHAALLFRVKDAEIEELYARLVEHGVTLATEAIVDRGGCGREIAFYDPDGRKIEVNTYGTWSSSSEPKVEGRIEPFLMDVITLYLPAKDPYTTAKWYVDILGFDPNASQHSPLKQGAGSVVLHTATEMELFFIQSEDMLPLSFNNEEGYNHAVLLFRVKDSEIEELYARLVEHGVPLATDAIVDRGGCGREIAFYDLDGRKVEINTFDT